MLKKLPIGEAFWVLALSGVVIMFGKLTLDKWDTEEWGFMILGLFGTLGSFAGLIAMVKHLMEYTDRNESM